VLISWRRPLHNHHHLKRRYVTCFVFFFLSFSNDPRISLPFFQAQDVAPPPFLRKKSHETFEPSALSRHVEVVDEEPESGETSPVTQEPVNWTTPMSDSVPALPPRRPQQQAGHVAGISTSPAAPPAEELDLTRDVDDIGYTSTPETPNPPEHLREKPSTSLLSKLASLTDLLAEEDPIPANPAPPASSTAAHSTQKSVIVCARCNMVIESGDSYLSAMDAHWHSVCFLCAVSFPNYLFLPFFWPTHANTPRTKECGETLDQGFYEHEGQALCTPHYLKKIGMVCAGCQEVITGHYMEAAFLRFHEEHFHCTKCGVSLMNQPFDIREQRPFCVSCKS